MVETLVRISGKSITINWDSSKPNGDLRRLMDTTIQKNNGILPEHTLEEGLRITYNYYNENHVYNR
jgi:GDP-L-fucose synthase